LQQLRERALELVNEERRERGLEVLSQGPALDEAAQAHAEDMLRRNYYAHESPDGDTVMDRYLRAGGAQWHVTAENIARCRGCPSPATPDRVESLHEGWMDSPPHRENILRRGLDRFGFSIVIGFDQTLYAVQTFAGAGMPREMQPGEEAHAIGADQQTALALERINEERIANNLDPLEAASMLIHAASTLVPERNLNDFTPDLEGKLVKALPGDARHEWQSVAAVVGRCGGCGTQPTAPDIRFFIKQWLSEPNYRRSILRKDLTHLGLVVRANGDGLKIAMAVLGQHR
jgi:uncharacterized protein YkwD